MANYKRKRPRTSGTHSPYNRREPQPFNSWMMHHPRWFDILNHTRRRRREADKLTRSVIRGGLDADAVSWPHSKSPSQYYW